MQRRVQVVTAMANDADELALADGYIRANELDRNAERQRQRRKLIDLGRRLTSIRVSLDDAFEALNTASAQIDEDERRQLDAAEQFKLRRSEARDRQAGSES